MGGDGTGGASSSSSSGLLAIEYSPPSHLPRSMSLQRSEQNGKAAFWRRGAASRLQMGQRAMARVVPPGRWPVNGLERAWRGPARRAWIAFVPKGGSMQLRRAATASLALVAMAALAGALAFGEARIGGAQSREHRGLVRAEIRSIAVGGGSPPIGVIVLAPAGSGLVVPLFVTAGEAGIVGERRTAGAQPSDLARAALSALGGRLTGVVLDGVENPTARAELSTPHGQRSIDASVADALEWAVSSNASIWLTPKLIHGRGISERQLEHLAPGLAPESHGAAPPQTGAPKPESPTL